MLMDVEFAFRRKPSTGDGVTSESYLAEQATGSFLCTAMTFTRTSRRYRDALLSARLSAAPIPMASEHSPRPSSPGDQTAFGGFTRTSARHHGGARAATEHLIATGAQSIAHVTSTRVNHNERQRGYREALRFTPMPSSWSWLHPPTSGHQREASPLPG